MTAGRPSKARRVMDKVKDTLVACGLQEIITFSFMNPRLFDELNLPADDPRRNAVKIHNPLTEEQGVLRTTLIPGMLQVMQYNFNRQIDNQLLFETTEVKLFDDIPDNLTYPLIQPFLHRKVLEFLEKGN